VQAAGVSEILRPCTLRTYSQMIELLPRTRVSISSKYPTHTTKLIKPHATVVREPSTVVTTNEPSRLKPVLMLIIGQTTQSHMARCDLRPSRSCPSRK
jgi:hypothetical protein